MYYACRDYYKDAMKIEPGEAARLQAITWLPWSFKIFYAVIVDYSENYLLNQ